jgi:hypothetical protein
VPCGYNLVKKKEWLIDWNNTFLYKEKVDGKIITFWSSDQPPFLVSNIILTTNMLTLMVRHIRFLFFFWYSRTSQVIDPYGRGVYIYIYTLLNSAASSQSIFALSSLKKYPMFIKVCFLAQTKKERKSKLSIASHIICLILDNLSK